MEVQLEFAADEHFLRDAELVALDHFTAALHILRTPARLSLEQQIDERTSIGTTCT